MLRDGNRVVTGDAGGFTQDTLISQMVGRELRFIPMRNESGKCDETLFEVKGYTREPYFRNVSLSVCKHEILGLTGLVGAGRSEWAQTVFGLMKPQGGELFLSGKKVCVSGTNDAIRKGICYLPEDKRTQGLFQGKPLTQNITSAMLRNAVRAGCLPEARNRTRRSILTSRHPPELAGNQRRKLSVATSRKCSSADGWRRTRRC